MRNLLVHPDVIKSVTLARNHQIPFSQDIESQISGYTKDYKVVIYEAVSGIHNITFYALLFDKKKPLPAEINKHEYLLVKMNAEWKRKILLGVCDGCGCYDELVMLSSDGEFCRECVKTKF